MSDIDRSLKCNSRIHIVLTHPFFLFFLSCAEHPELSEFNEHIESELKCRCMPLFGGGNGGKMSTFCCRLLPTCCCSGCGGCWPFTGTPMLCMCAVVSPAWIDCLRKSSIVCRISRISPSFFSVVAVNCCSRAVMLERLCSNADTTWACKKEQTRFFFLINAK